MHLKPSNESLRRKIAADPDDEPTAGNVPTREDQLEHALREMMAAFENRARSAGQTWRCLEYIAAEQLLASRR